MAGSRTYKKRRAEAKGGSVFRSRLQMDQNREVNLMFLKSTWFYDKSHEDGPMRSRLGPLGRGGPVRASRAHLTKQQLKFQSAAVMFVPRSHGGKLLTTLGKAEVDLQSLGSTK